MLHYCDKMPDGVMIDLTAQYVDGFNMSRRVEVGNGATVLDVLRVNYCPFCGAILAAEQAEIIKAEFERDRLEDMKLNG